MPNPSKTQFTPEGTLDLKFLEDMGLVSIKTWLRNRLAGSDPFLPIDKRVDEDPEAVIVSLVRDLGPRHPVAENISRAVLSLLDSTEALKARNTPYFKVLIRLCQQVKLLHTSSWFNEFLKQLSLHPENVEEMWGDYDCVDSILAAAKIQAPGFTSAASTSYWESLLLSEKYTTRALLALGQTLKERLPYIENWWSHCVSGERCIKLRQFLRAHMRVDVEGLDLSLRSYEYRLSPELKHALNDALEAEGLKPVFSLEPFGSVPAVVSEALAIQPSHLEVLRQFPAVADPLEPISNHLIGSFRRHMPPHFGTLAQKPEHEQVAVFKWIFSNLNGADRSYVAREFGQVLAESERQKLVTKVDADLLTRSLVKASHLNSSCEKQAFSAQFVQQRAKILWQGRGREFDKVVPVRLDLQASVLEQARRVKDEADACGVSALNVAISQFHEDRILHALMKAALIHAEMYGLVPCTRKWGGLQTKEATEADFGLMRTGTQTHRISKQCNPSYSFKGYYVFLRGDWLKRLVQDATRGVPRIVRDFVQEVHHSDKTAKPRTRLKQSHEIAVRAWVAVSGGFSRNQENGFREPVKRLRAIASKIGTPLSPPQPMTGQASHSMDDEFEAFLKGEVSAFMGGAIHARLLKRWWTDQDQPFLEWITPTQVQSIMRPTWKVKNALVFSKHCFPKAKKRVNLIEAIEDLYVALGKAIANIIQTPDNIILDYLIYSLVMNNFDDNELRWSFVTERDDILSLLSQDNEGWGKQTRK